jgi:two-component system, chemotaxis family, CheB/CheR fusion protein
MTSPFPDLSGLTILVVDDNEDALYVLKTLLEACGATVLAARNAFAALGYLETTRVSVLLSDLSMPQMDGIELIERIRKSPQHRETPAIAISAFPESFRSAVPAGFNLFMRKPIDIDTLCGAIFALVKEKPESA